MKKRKVVLNDKAKIASVIEELDKKKKAALIKAWEQVNKVCFQVVNMVTFKINTYLMLFSGVSALITSVFFQGLWFHLLNTPAWYSSQIMST